MKFTKSSEWGNDASGNGLSRHLMGQIFPVDRKGSWIPEEDAVEGPVTDAELSMTANWQSPFEQFGPETQAPTVMAMLQTGALQSYLTPFIKGVSPDGKGEGLVSRLARDVSDFVRNGEGRSGITKLNSTQFYNGSPPARITMTMHFRAWSDPEAEVQRPVDQLIEWSLPQALARSGTFVEAIQRAAAGENIIAALLPSRTPQLVGLIYRGRTFSPMVIEQLQVPMSGPVSIGGGPLHLAVQMTLSTLTAIDAADWTRMRDGFPIRLFNNS